MRRGSPGQSGPRGRGEYAAHAARLATVETPDWQRQSGKPAIQLDGVKGGRKAQASRN